MDDRDLKIVVERRDLFDMLVNSSITNNNTNSQIQFPNVPILLHISIATLITVSNALVIFIYISMKRKMKKIPNYLMFAQALVDMYQAGLALYETVVEILLRSNVAVPMYIMDTIYGGLLEYSLTLCLLTLMLATTERYMCLSKPFLHRKYVTKNRLIHGSMLVYLASLFPPLSLLAVAKFDQFHLNGSNVVIYSYAFDIFMLLTITFIVCTLVLSFKIGKDSMNAGMNSQKTIVTEKTEIKLDCIMKKKIRLVVIFSIMLAAFLISVLPFVVGRLLYDSGMLKEWSPSSKFILLSTCHIIYKSSSLFNPMLTLTMKDDYKEGLMKYLRRTAAFYPTMKETIV